MMKNYLLYILLGVGFFATAQKPPKVSVKVDTTKIRIGEQINYQITVDDAETGVVFPKLGMIPMLDAETGKTILVNTNSKKVRTNYRTHYLKTVDYFEDTFKRSGSGTINNRIDESYVKKLLGYFKRRGAK